MLRSNSHVLDVPDGFMRSTTATQSGLASHCEMQALVVFWALVYVAILGCLLVHDVAVMVTHDPLGVWTTP
jgi:hypothetical protein